MPIFLSRILKNSLIAILILCVNMLPACSAQISDNSSQQRGDNGLSPDLTPAALYSALQKVADWQLSKYNPETNLMEGFEEGAHFAAHNSDSHPQGWVYAALHVGMMHWAELALSNGDDRYIKWEYDVAKKGKYLFSPRIYNADDYAIGQLYLDLYEHYKDPEILKPLKVIFDIILHTPSTVDLRYELITDRSDVYEGPYIDAFGGREFPLAPCKNRWCWADALFMGPPVWIHLASVTGDQRYLDFADRELWETVNLLWDQQDHLFFRDTRFFERREPNGEKVIWARGVGWVAAGLARILEHLPKDHPSRGQYEDIFKKMMTRLAGAQQSDGLWRPSVLDPETKPFKETSGTALMSFAFASGINQGLLDRETFYPVLQKSWPALVKAVQPDGKLGWVQQIGEKPDNVSKDDSQLYAVGAFLLTGTELYKMHSN